MISLGMLTLTLYHCVMLHLVKVWPYIIDKRACGENETMISDCDRLAVTVLVQFDHSNDAEVVCIGMVTFLLFWHLRTSRIKTSSPWTVKILCGIYYSLSMHVLFVFLQMLINILLNLSLHVTMKQELHVPIQLVASNVNVMKASLEIDIRALVCELHTCTYKLL